MKIKKTKKLINNILKENATEAGIFISLLSNSYLEIFDLSKEEFLNSLKNSIEILEDEKNKLKGDK